ncbi:MBL fold metallo-hydrolase [Ramlibacter henchirensis]|uniref:MBL fold metallo-hydrolase n=1 Tax=Ramlibacter henchirensis TaxID=204072 RepID=A0A4Z0BVK7_9BURK|nr:MBL fold metallo-hydrolase [Ramlibacter henchirensis]TFZ02732.1 MBL fold metallo-hydrolase [Ramlibacter henchirensis]
MTQGARDGNPLLTYPLATPGEGSFVPVAPGVWWVRLALAGPLAHINVWALEEGEGWTLVDTGVGSEATIAAWEALLAQEPFARRLRRVIVTHMHPDHIGMAGWFTRRFGVQLWMSRLEYLTCRVTASDTGREPPPDAMAFYRAAGWDDAALAAYRQRFGRFGRYIQPMPDSYRRLRDGERIRIGDDEWEVVTGNGHSPEHACLYCAGRRLLISGDQVLPRISSNVSVQPMEPGANPMADWLASLEKLRSRVPDDVLVLPAHNECFRGLHARLRQLETGQHEALDKLRERLREPRRVVDCFVALFRRTIEPGDASLLGMATGETVACLNWLIARAEAVRWIERDVAWYRMAN